MTEVFEGVDLLKVGGKILVDGHDDRPLRFNDDTFTRVGEEVSESAGSVVLVSSAAIAAGMLATGTMARPDKKTQMPELQRLSNIGWREVHNRWAKSIPVITGGLLLTRQELKDSARSEEALGSIGTHLAHGEVPVANENDGIAHEEITFGSNDILAAMLAARMQRNGEFGRIRLFLLTDVNGVYRNRENPNTRIPVIRNTAMDRYLAHGTNSGLSIGGMASKFEAADIAKAAGVNMWIYNPADGHRDLAVAGEIGTYFPA